MHPLTLNYPLAHVTLYICMFIVYLPLQHKKGMDFILFIALSPAPEIADWYTVVIQWLVAEWRDIIITTILLTGIVIVSM